MFQGLRQKIYKISPEHLGVAESKKMRGKKKSTDGENLSKEQRSKLKELSVGNLYRKT